MAAFRTKVMRTYCPDALSTNARNSFYPAYSPHQSPGPSLYITCLDYLLTLGSTSNSSVAQIHYMLQTRSAASPIQVLAIIIAIQTTCRLQWWCLWATGEHYIFCTYMARCGRHGFGIGINRRGIGQARGRYDVVADSCYVWPLNEEISILLMESAAGKRP